MAAKITVIRIDLEVYQEIKKRAEPLIDTPNMVLRRVFGLPEHNPRQEARKSKQSSKERKK